MKASHSFSTSTQAMADKENGSERADAASEPLSENVPPESTPPSSPVSNNTGLARLGISPLTPEERAAKRDALLRRQKESRAFDVSTPNDGRTATGESSAPEMNVPPLSSAPSPSSTSPKNTQQAAKLEPCPLPTPSVSPDRISQAVAFLSSPSVRSAPLVRQTEFLKRKGLTTEEIEYARTKCNEKLDSITAFTNTDASPMIANAGLPPPIPIRTENSHWESPIQYPLMKTQLNSRKALAIIIFIAGIGFGSVAALLQHLAGEAWGRFRAARGFVLKMQYFRLSFFTTLTRAMSALYTPLQPSIRQAEKKAIEERENILKDKENVDGLGEVQEKDQGEKTTLCATLENDVCEESTHTIATLLESRQTEFIVPLSRLPQIINQLFSTKGECDKSLQSVKSVASSLAETANGIYARYLNRIGSQLDTSDSANSANEELQKRHRAAVDNLKGEIRSAKGLLLSRKNFRSPAPSAQPP